MCFLLISTQEVVPAARYANRSISVPAQQALQLTACILVRQQQAEAAAGVVHVAFRYDAGDGADQYSCLYTAALQ